MLEFGVLIIIVVAIWKFSGTVDEVADVAEEAARSYTEDKLTDYALEREDRVKELNVEMEKRNITEFTSHDNYMKKLGYKSK